MSMAILEEELQETRSIHDAVAGLFKSVPWLRGLPAEEVATFLVELYDMMESDPEMTDLDQKVAFLREWKATADAYKSPEAVAELLEPADDEDPIPLRRGA